MIIIERGFPLLKLAVAGTAMVAIAVVARRLLKSKAQQPAVVVVKRVDAPQTARAEVHVPWGVEAQ